MNYQLLSLSFCTQTRYKAQNSQENKRIYFPYYQLFAFFLFSPFLPYFAHFLLFSTLLVHFEIPFSFVPLQYRKTKENQSFSVITRLRYLNRDKTSKQWQSQKIKRKKTPNWSKTGCRTAESACIWSIIWVERKSLYWMKTVIRCIMKAARCRESRSSLSSITGEKRTSACI